jgi:hypothetical protein
MDIEKLVKVLGMMGSEHDGEALAALRTAQKMMAAAKVSWKDLLKPTVTIEPKMDHRRDSYPYNPYANTPYQADIAMQAEMLRREMARQAYERAKREADANAAKYKSTLSAEQINKIYENLFGKKRP